VLSLAADDPEGARRHLHEAMAEWSQNRYLVQHWQAMHYEAEIELYVGDGARAYERVVRDERALKRSFLLRAQVIRTFTTYLRGRCALVSIAAVPARRAQRLKEAAVCARRLERESAPWANALGSIVRASLESEKGDRDGAIASLREAIDRADTARLVLHAAAARRQLGIALGGDEGDALFKQGEGTLTAQDVVAPSRMADRLVPGHWT
ncbi:MAG: hypothetical protein ACREJ3_17895, partial [Polyangiaceae bacterium]